MKRKVYRLLSFSLAILLIFTTGLTANFNVAEAKDKKREVIPQLSILSKTLNYSGETFEITLKDTSDIKKVTWYTLNEKVATITPAVDNNYKATVTSIRQGATIVKVKITMKSGKVYRPGCLIVVKSSEKNQEATTVQGKLISLTRTSADSISATFDKAIEIPGILLLNNKTTVIEGVVNSKDNKVVSYTIPSELRGQTGWQKVWIGYYSSPNVIIKNGNLPKFTEQYIEFTMNSVEPLPAPQAIFQDGTNNSLITLLFGQKLDKATAETISNYYIGGLAIESVKLTNQNQGALVTLKLKGDSILATGSYNIIISGLKGLDNSYGVMNVYQTTITLKENISPTLITYYYTNNAVVLLFSETITGNSNFKVLQKNTDYFSYSIINGNTVTLMLKSTPSSNVTMQIMPTNTTSIMDLAGNPTTSDLNRSLLAAY